MLNKERRKRKKMALNPHQSARKAPGEKGDDLIGLSYFTFPYSVYVCVCAVSIYKYTHIYMYTVYKYIYI